MLNLDQFTLCWQKALKRKILRLEKQGYNVGWAREILKGRGTSSDLKQLYSLDSELEAFELLAQSGSREVLRFRDGRLDFRVDDNCFEVWGPQSILPQRRMLGLIEYLWMNLRWDPRRFYQILYSPHSPSPFKRFSYSTLPKGFVKFGAEILVDLSVYQKELALHLMKEIDRRRAKFLKTRASGGIIIDLRRLHVANPAVLAKYMQTFFKPKVKDIFHGILLMFYDMAGKTKFIVVPNPLSQTPFTTADFKKSAMEEVPYVKYAYTMPLVVHYEKAGTHHYFTRNKNGVFVFEDKEVVRSLIRNGTVVFTGLAEKPDKTKYIEFCIDNKRKARIPF